MEEDIEILSEMLIHGEDKRQALGNGRKRVKELEQIEKEHQKINGELRVENEDLRKSVDMIYEDYQDIGEKFFDLQEESERKLRIKDEYLTNLINIGCDYDGCNTVESLKELIDELVDIAKRAFYGDDKTAAYIGSNGKVLNILKEEIEPDNHIPHID